MKIKALKTTILSVILTLIMILGTSIAVYASPQTVIKNKTDGYTFYIHNSVENPTQTTVDVVIKNNIMVQGQTYVIYFDNEAGRISLKSLLPDIQLLGQTKNSIHRQALTTEQVVILEKNAVPMETAIATPNLSQQPSNVTSPAKDTVPTQLTSEEMAESKATLYTNEQLTEMAANAPTPSETRSKIKMTNNRMTDEQLNAWIAEYEELGSANAFELEVIRLINIERAKEGLEPLAISKPLMLTARFRAQEMIDLNYFSHESLVYNEWAGGASNNIAAMFGHENERFILTGNGTLTGAGENLAKGQLTAENLVKAWMNSPGHKRPLMDSEVKSIGIGRILTITTANFGY